MGGDGTGVMGVLFPVGLGEGAVGMPWWEPRCPAVICDREGLGPVGFAPGGEGSGSCCPTGRGGRAGSLFWDGGEVVASWVTCGERGRTGSFPASLLNHGDPVESSFTTSSLAPLGWKRPLLGSC